MSRSPDIYPLLYAWHRAKERVRRWVLETFPSLDNSQDWNPWNKVVQSHRYGAVWHKETNRVRKQVGLVTPWHPGLNEDLTKPIYFTYKRKINS